MDNLINKSKEIGATKYGAFSKNGFALNIKDKEYDLITVADLFK